MSIRCLLVDDESLARERVRTLLHSEHDIEIVRECADGPQAIAAILELRPDLVFLDVQMPGMTGFEVIAEIGPDAMPPVIFVTAFDEYALNAFDVNAADYLLKPFDPERFQKAVARARRAIEQHAPAEYRERMAHMLAQLRGGRKPVERIVVRSGGSVVFLNLEEIDWVEAAGNYVRLHAGRDIHLLRETMHSIETRLNPHRFARIHRSRIVNVERVREIQPQNNPDERGDFVVLLRCGTRLAMSRTHRDNLSHILGAAI